MKNSLFCTVPISWLLIADSSQVAVIIYSYYNDLTTTGAAGK